MEPLLNLVYQFRKENMHKSRIIISVNPKIMINSQDLKNINKIIYADLAEMEKHF
jgi:hypothetical protein